MAPILSIQFVPNLFRISEYFEKLKELRALRGYFSPPMRPKNEIRFSPNSSYWFFRTMTQVYKSDISLTFTVAMVTKMAKRSDISLTFTVAMVTKMAAKTG